VAIATARAIINHENLAGKIDEELQRIRALQPAGGHIEVNPVGGHLADGGKHPNEPPPSWIHRLLPYSRTRWVPSRPVGKPRDPEAVRMSDATPRTPSALPRERMDNFNPPK
jgi:hypothetical protein